MKAITESDVVYALTKVIDPELKRDVVSLQMVRDIHIEGGKVVLTLMLTTPACPLRNYLQKAVYDAVMAIEGVDSVTVNIAANVASQPTMNENALGLSIKNSIAISSGRRSRKNHRQC